MTDNLFQKLEEKMMLLLAEIEDSRREIARLTQENAMLKREQEAHSSKLADLISLLDSVSLSDVMTTGASVTAIKPMTAQG
ncbi:hypothetical protein AQUSIP_16130 [Aquicella siphonis]|uniref:Cell division protein ZapB n=1 Tax=Aquicella siphonis TaxID=254247 RepID=A0A5E4PHB5_9COXI|nr:DNA replication initiation control protein YabA [Aquicella siphonis]VVC76304.1 hypothetical protein AQUSIP_16130 [Aquicella siphonis]